MQEIQNIRNIAIIAHVDHGKTTLVDKILHQVKIFRDNQEVSDLILDNNDLERERGITILSKNVSVRYKDVKINIIDTPGHSDFGGEVERVLNMADGVLLVVDAFEGPMPQTRFVLQKAVELNLKPIVVINKVDKPNCNPELAQEAVFDLMFNLGASEDQLDFPTVYGSSKNGWMSDHWENVKTDVTHLLDSIIEHIPAPKVSEGSAQMMISSLDYSSFQGRIAVGRVNRGQFEAGDNVVLIKRDGTKIKSKIKEIFVFEGLIKDKCKGAVKAGELCAIMGIEGFDIGDTIADSENPEALQPIKIDEPTMSMLFTVNNSPFFGKEGELVTSRHIKERLEKELEKNLALKVEPTESPESHIVFGRGILHLSILIETMRREGYELQLGQPQVIIKEIDGKKCEPVEVLTVIVPEEFVSKVIDQVTQRKGDILSIDPKGDRMVAEFSIPSRGIIGLRNTILTVTQGEAIMTHRFKDFEPWKGDIGKRQSGSLIVKDTGVAIPYAIDKLQDRGKFFVDPGENVYEGQVVGEHIRPDDLVINITVTKKLTNMRSSGNDDKVSITPAIKFSLEEAMEYVGKDEYLEVTPKSLRLRKILLTETERKKYGKS